MELQRLAIQLERRRHQLGMSCSVIAARAGVGLRTVQRALSGKEKSEFQTLDQIARALGASIDVRLRENDVDAVKRQQALRKAARLVSITQGTSGLEAQAVPEKTLARMREKTAMKLLSGSPRTLWAE